MGLGRFLGFSGAAIAAFLAGAYGGLFDSILLAIMPTLVKMAIKYQLGLLERFVTWKQDDALHVFLCGTGSPMPDPSRSGPCTAVFGGGHFFIFDTGPGSVKRIQLHGLDLGQLDALFYTHYHSDHIGDMGDALVNTWIGGRRVPLDVYGPTGIARVLGGVNEQYSLDQKHRSDHHTEQYMPSAAARGVPKEFAVPGPGGAVILETESGLKVTAFEVDHRPVYPAVGFKVEYKGRTVVISGDGMSTQELNKQLENADLMVRNAINKEWMWSVSQSLNETGIERSVRLGKMTWDTLDYHSDTSDALKDASEQNVKAVVICHLAPAPRNWLLKLAQQAQYRKRPAGWAGQLIFGEDGMHFELRVGSQEVKQL